MAPGIVANEVAQLVIALNMGAWQFLLLDMALRMQLDTSKNLLPALVSI